MKDRRDEGIIHKYNVERVDGKPVGEGIFLEFKDPKAWYPLMMWAEGMAKDGYLTLYREVKDKIQFHMANQPGSIRLEHLFR